MKTNNSLSNDQPTAHLDGGELHDFCSLWPARELTLEEETRIAEHLEQCSECRQLGEAILQQDLDFEEKLAAGSIRKPIPEKWSKLLEGELAREFGRPEEGRGLSWESPQTSDAQGSSVLTTALAIANTVLSLTASPAVPLKNVMERERGKHNLAKVTLITLRALALEDTGILSIMIDNITSKKIPYEYYCMGPHASQQISNLHQLFLSRGVLDLSNKVTFFEVELKDQLVKILFNLFAPIIDGAWIYQYSDGNLEVYVIYRLDNLNDARVLPSSEFQNTNECVRNIPFEAIQRN